MATPVMPFSDRGMSITRWAPYFCCSPRVVPKMPLGSGTPSPMMYTAGSFAMQRSVASLIAWANFSVLVIVALSRSVGPAQDA